LRKWPNTVQFHERSLVVTLSQRELRSGAALLQFRGFVK
jgi:hypothetical protein